MNLKEIRTLIDLMEKKGLAVFKLEREGFKITLKRAGAESITPIVSHGPLPTFSPPSDSSPTPPPSLKEIKSPMVGTFYAAASPEASPFVTTGQEVTPDTVVCIVEAMKVMNEIKAETTGVLAEICAENGKPVQFGQPLFRLK